MKPTESAEALLRELVALGPNFIEDDVAAVAARAEALLTVSPPHVSCDVLTRDHPPDGYPDWLTESWADVRKAWDSASLEDRKTACMHLGKVPSLWMREWRRLGIKHTLIRASLMLWWRSRHDAWPTAAEVAGITPVAGGLYIGPHTCGGLRVLRLLVDERLPHVGPADECGRRRCLGCADCSGGEE